MRSWYTGVGGRLVVEVNENNGIFNTISCKRAEVNESKKKTLQPFSLLKMSYVWADSCSHDKRLYNLCFKGIGCKNTSRWQWECGAQLQLSQGGGDTGKEVLRGG